MSNVKATKATVVSSIAAAAASQLPADVLANIPLEKVKVAKKEKVKVDRGPTNVDKYREDFKQKCSGVNWVNGELRFDTNETPKEVVARWSSEIGGTQNAARTEYYKLMGALSKEIKARAAEVQAAAAQ